MSEADGKSPHVVMDQVAQLEKRIEIGGDHRARFPCRQRQADTIAEYDQPYIGAARHLQGQHAGAKQCHAEQHGAERIEDPRLEPDDDLQYQAGLQAFDGKLAGFAAAVDADGFANLRVGEVGMRAPLSGRPGFHFCRG